ncbi:DUF7689 domain-containing protein [Candidatus Phycorickettsia trachydisci]|nr:hypothetical protein [Candidatus Phycorickettsia trachydisci]
MEEWSLKYSELEEYIHHLTAASKDLLSDVTNHLRKYGLTEKVSEVAEEIVNKMILLNSATWRYNCYGWSFGCIDNVNFDLADGQFADQILLSRKEERFKINTDPTMYTFFAIFESKLVENNFSIRDEGNIVIYSNPDKQMTHSARYVKTLGWYHYEEELYKDWYDRDRGCVSFDETGKICIIESYTSKLGSGHLVAHGLEDIVPLYGSVDGFFDLAL